MTSHVPGPAGREDIAKGRVVEAHVARAAEVLRSEGANPTVAAELRAGALPHGWSWMVVAGSTEGVSLLEGRPLDVWGLEEGSVAYAEEPVLQIAGRYAEFAELATALVGTLSYSSGVATVAARLKLVAGERAVYAAAGRMVHPAVVPVLEHAAYVGGCDAVTTIPGAEQVGRDPVLSMDHDVALILGVPRAWTAFHRVVEEEDVPRIAAVDTLLDERAGALAAVEALGSELRAIRLDVPGTVDGVARTVREVRWELDARGHTDVQIVLAGDLDERAVQALARLVDGFCVAGPLASSPPVPFALDLVEVDGRPLARRGRFSGRKTLWRCEDCGNRGIAPERAHPEGCPRCGGTLTGLLAPLLRQGAVEEPPSAPSTARDRALQETATAANPFV
jgi:nicotinate phosphoribosyltransferase